MQKYRSFASFRHRIIIELPYYLGMTLEEAIECTGHLSLYLKHFRAYRDFFDYRKYGPQSYIFMDGEHIVFEKSSYYNRYARRRSNRSRLKQAP